MTQDINRTYHGLTTALGAGVDTTIVSAQPLLKRVGMNALGRQGQHARGAVHGGCIGRVDPLFRRWENVPDRRSHVRGGRRDPSRHPGRRGCDPGWPVWLRQVHAAQHDCGADGAVDGDRALSWKAGRRAQSSCRLYDPKRSSAAVAQYRQQHLRAARDQGHGARQGPKPRCGAC